MNGLLYSYVIVVLVLPDRLQTYYGRFYQFLVGVPGMAHRHYFRIKLQAPGRRAKRPGID